MKRIIATLSALAIVGGTTTAVVVADGNTERPVVAADSQSDRGEEDHRSSRTGIRKPIVSEIEQMAIDKRANLKNQIEREAREERAEAKRKAEAKKERERKAEAARVAAAVEKARKARQVNRKPVVTKTRPPVRSNNHVAPGGIAACIRKYESGGNYRAQNPVSTASGAYQFLDSTWQSVTGLPGRAMNYSPAQQDAAFWKLWNNGRGANQWVTAGMCGY